MTKADIVEGVYERLGGFSKKEAAAIVETILDVMKDALEALYLGLGVSGPQVGLRMP